MLLNTKVAFTNESVVNKNFTKYSNGPLVEPFLGSDQRDLKTCWDSPKGVPLLK